MIFEPAQLFSAIPLLSLYPLISFMRRDRSIEHLIPAQKAEKELGLPAHQPSIPPAASSIQQGSGLGQDNTPRVVRITDSDAKPAQVREIENFDEFVAEGARVHIEQMSDNHYWMGISVGERDFHINFSSRGKLTGILLDESDGFVPQPIAACTDGLSPAKEAAPKTKSRNSRGPSPQPKGPRKAASRSAKPTSPRLAAPVSRRPKP